MRYFIPILSFFLFYCATDSAAQSLFLDKVEPNLMLQLEAQPNDFQEVVLILKDQIDVLGESELMQKAGLSLHEQRVRLVQLLEKKAQTTQPELLAVLQEIKGIEKGSIQNYWIANLIQIRANLKAVKTLNQLDAIETIEGVPTLTTFIEEPTASAWQPPAPNTVEENLLRIRADELWRMGYTGYGTKVLVIDSGQDYLHPSLRGNFFGNNVPFREAWAGVAAPEDCGVFHGTHVAGVITGIDRIANDTIGVAYNAKWLGGPTLLDDCELVQNIRTNIGNLQWALNPDGNNNTTDDMPDVINNSWGSEGGCINFYRDILNTLEAAGIAVVWAAGNSGPEPETISGQASINTSLLSAFSVGSVGTNDLRITDFSSRGPSGCGGENGLEIKPEVVAPGEQIRSTSEDGGYRSLNGTSFAVPHIAGAILLLKEAFPELPGRDLKGALYRTAIDLGPEGEDNTYGAGFIDVLAAYNYLIDQGNTPIAPASVENDVVLVDVFSQQEVFCLGEVTNGLIFENVSNSTLRSLTIDYRISGPVSRTDRVEWTGSLRYDDVEQVILPTLSDLPAGEYELLVDIFSPNGRPDARSQNNRIRHSFVVADLLAVEAQLAVTYENEICREANVLLESEMELADNQYVRWYTGPFNDEFIGEGDQVATPPITDRTIYYADIITESRAGKLEVTEDERTSYAIDDAGLRFDAHQDFLLKSVKVFAEESGGRIIKLNDRQGNLLSQKVVNIPEGESRVELDIEVPAGEDYELRLTAGKALLHSNSNVDYPYEIDNVISIESSANPTTSFRYFFFYDWDIESYHVCGRTALVVEPTTNQRAASIDFTVSEEEILVDESIDFTSQIGQTQNVFWNFGDGTTSTDRNPSHIYTMAGFYVITLTTTSANGCSSSASMRIEVVEDMETSIQTISSNNAILVYPNPAHDQVTIELEKASSVRWQLLDALGRQVQVNIAPTFEQRFTLNLQNIPSGIYYLQLQFEEESVVKKIMINK